MKKAFLPFSLPDIGDAEVDAVVAALRSGWVTTGPQTKDFEREFASFVGAPHAVAVNSCTAALHLALEACGVGPADEVIVPAMTFAATGEVVRYLGARPVIVDIRSSDHQVDPEAIERAVTPKTKAIVPVHFAGQPYDVPAVLELARTLRLRVVEDAAHALPAAIDGRTVGSFADVTCFSFYATKTITTGEGGMATTADDGLAERMRIMSLHGISKDAWKRYTAKGSWRYDIVAPGYKYNLTDIASSMGRVQLRRAEQMWERRSEIAERYLAALSDEPGVELLDVLGDRQHAWHLFVVKLAPQAWRIHRDQFVDELRNLGIGSSVHFIPLHLHSYYRETFGYRPSDLPTATDTFERSFSLPLYSRMSNSDVDRVLEAVRTIGKRFRR
jgi:perosamine synthetase